MAAGENLRLPAKRRLPPYHTVADHRVARPQRKTRHIDMDVSSHNLIARNDACPLDLELSSLIAGPGLKSAHSGRVTGYTEVSLARAFRLSLSGCRRSAREEPHSGSRAPQDVFR